ncbi:hypothetical protein ACHAWX_006472 [Stephanocyclus meneghinianus]
MTASALSVIAARHGRSLAFSNSRQSFNGRRLFASYHRSSCLSPSFAKTWPFIHNNQSRSTSLWLSMSRTDDDDATIGTLPYSTTASTPAKVKPQLSKSSQSSSSSSPSSSSLPFSAPRNAFDDSLPSAMLSDNNSGVLEWSKLGLLTDLVDALTSNPLQLTGGPTPVQKMAIPEILRGCKERMAHVETLGAKKKAAGLSKQSSFDVHLSVKGAATEGDININAIPPVKSVAFAAATGSGKTLAYLLPIIQSLRAQELITLSNNNSTASMEALSRLRRPRRPRALVLAPTRELARQILSVLKSLSHTCKISSELLVGGDDYGSQRKRMENRPVDVLVATPGRLVKHRDAGDVFLGSVRHIVVDEFDTMLEQGFQNDIGTLLHPMLYKKKTITVDEYKSGKLELVEGAPQIILTTATMTPAVRRLLDRPDLPFAPKRVYGKQAVKQEDGASNNVKIALPRDIRVLTAPGLHRVVPRLKQVFVNVGGVDKLSLLVDLVAGGERQKRERQERGDGGKSLPLTLVFCNTVASCRAAEHALAESGVASLCYHGDLNSDVREENLMRFRKAGSEGGDADDDATVLVCTDIASRGLDVPQVDHVIMFDFPLNPIDYLHRAGRTARGLSSSVGGEGKVTALVTKRDRVLATAIEGAVQRGESLEGLSSRKSDYVAVGGRGSGRGGREGTAGRGGRGSGRGSRGGGRGSGRGGSGRSSRR